MLDAGCLFNCIPISLVSPPSSQAESDKNAMRFSFRLAEKAATSKRKELEASMAAREESMQQHLDEVRKFRHSILGIVSIYGNN